jgi:transketolase
MRNYLDFNRSKTVPFMRDIFIDAIYEEAKNNKNIFFLTPDMGAPSLDKFKKDLPNQFIHCGICEQHMISMSAGLSLMGKSVFCYAMAPFITSRCYEQIKCSIAAMNQNVNLIGIGVGLGYADAGPTHYTTEDLSIMRVFPNIEILTPCDEFSTKFLAKYVIKNNKFRFIRLDRDALPSVYNSQTKFDVEKGFNEIFLDGETCIISNGYLLNKIHKILLETNKNIGLIDLYKVKPLNKTLLNTLIKYKKIITIEEQWLSGGIGSLVLEFLNDNNLKKKIIRYGLQERFFFENGGRDYLHKNYGLDLRKIISGIV